MWRWNHTHGYQNSMYSTHQRPRRRITQAPGRPPGPPCASCSPRSDLERPVPGTDVIQYTLIIVDVIYLGPEEIAHVPDMHRGLVDVLVQHVLPPEVVPLGS